MKHRFVPSVLVLSLIAALSASAFALAAATNHCGPTARLSMRP